MSLKILLGSVFGGIVLVSGAYFIISPNVDEALVEVTEEEASEVMSTETEADTTIDDEVAKEESEEEEKVEDTGKTEVATPAPTPTPTPAPAPTPTPTPTPAPTPAPAPTPDGYTTADVAKHASAGSCWSIVNGSVYDLTAFIGKHPGGESRILRMCGKDGTASFEDQHGRSSKVAGILAKYRIGDLI